METLSFYKIQVTHTSNNNLNHDTDHKMKCLNQKLMQLIKGLLILQELLQRTPLLHKKESVGLSDDL